MTVTFALLYFLFTHGGWIGELVRTIASVGTLVALYQTNHVREHELKRRRMERLEETLDIFVGHDEHTRNILDSLGNRRPTLIELTKIYGRLFRSRGMPPNQAYDAAMELLERLGYIGGTAPQDLEE
jgi:hypothetical protein